MAASDKGLYIDKAVPRLVKQILVRVTDGAGVSQRADTALPGGQIFRMSSPYIIVTNKINSEIRVTNHHSNVTEGTNYVLLKASNSNEKCGSSKSESSFVSSAQGFLTDCCFSGKLSGFVILFFW